MLPAGAARCPPSLVAEAARWCWEGRNNDRTQTAGHGRVLFEHWLPLAIERGAEYAEEANAEDAEEPCHSERRAEGPESRNLLCDLVPIPATQAVQQIPRLRVRSARNDRQRVQRSLFQCLQRSGCWRVDLGRSPQRQRAAPASSDSGQHAAPAGSASVQQHPAPRGIRIRVVSGPGQHAWPSVPAPRSRQRRHRRRGRSRCRT